jgi:uncharacterized protein YkwD
MRMNDHCRRAVFTGLLLAACTPCLAAPTKLFPTMEPCAADCLAAQAALQQAADLLSRAKLGEAAKLAEAAAQHMRNSASPRVLLGLILEQQQRPAEAADAYREALAWDPDEPRALAGLERLKAPRFGDIVSQYELQLFRAINDSRRAEGVPALKPHPILTEVARGHSTAMRDLGFFEHNSPKPGEKTPLERFLRCFDHKPRLMGENVARRWTRPQRALDEANVAGTHEQLMASPGHRKNILQPDFVYVGVGIAINPEGDYWVTEVFMAPPPPSSSSSEG